MKARPQFRQGGDADRHLTACLLGSPLPCGGRFCRGIALVAGSFGLMFILATELHFQTFVARDIGVSDGLCFILLSCSLWFRAVQPTAGVGNRLYRYGSVALGLLTAFVALSFFLRPSIEARTGMAVFVHSPPHFRSHHFTLLGFILLGAALALSKSGGHDRFPYAQLLAFAGIILGLLEVLGFAYDPSVNRAAVTIGEGLFLVGLSSAAACLHRGEGFIRDIFSSHAGGLMARRLLPVAIVVPVIIHWIGYELGKNSLISHDSRSQMETIIAIGLLAYVTIRTARLLNETDEDRERKGAALAEANQGLETKVAQRTEELRSASVRLQSELAERKAAEEKAVASERQLRMIFDQIPAAVWTTDTELRIVSGSESGRVLTNRPAESLLGITIQELLGAQDESFPLLAAHLAALKGKHIAYEGNWNGREFSVNLQPFREANGKISGVIGVALDITEDKKLLDSVAKLAAIVESSQDAIVGTSPSGHINTWNGGAEQMFGYSAAEIIGQHVSILVPEDRREEFELALGKIERGERVMPFETATRCKDGSLNDISITVSAIRGAMGSLIGISAILHDLSDRKGVERELQKLSARLLKAQDEARRKLARDLHDSVAQDLAAAAIELTALNQSADLRPENRKRVEKALRMAKQSAREIRTLSYLLHPPLLDERGLLAALQWYVEGYNKRSGIHVTFDLPWVQRRIGSEAEMALFRVVQEALTNVHRHSGGRHATVHMGQTQRDLVLSVSDDGHGMDANTLQKVQRGGAALGVGIAGMKERVRQLGGQLKVSSDRTGTTVTAILPIEG